jgi:predicted nucleic acid-binding protein
VAILVDTNVHVRLGAPDDPRHAIAAGAVDVLQRRDERLSVATQCLVEFWAVATRPLDANGLGRSCAEAAEWLQQFERAFSLLVEAPAIYTVWRDLVTRYRVSGRQVHDALLAAVMLVHGVTRILTFNTEDFARFPEIEAVDPQALAATVER